MGIEDIQISEELETNAPSIKYRGNEGPKSPQEMEQMMIASLEEEYAKYVFEMEEQGIQPMSLRQFMDQAMAEGQMSGGQPLPQDPTKPVNPFQPKPTGPVLPDRQMAAYGGIMGMDGRRQYGIGSFLKKTARKLIPNEIANIAEKAAPFVAPFNPIAAGLMSGIGGFDRTGSIGSSIKSGLMNYGLGQGARYLGGAGVQTGINPMTGSGVQGGKFFSSPMGSGGVKNLFNKPAPISEGIPRISGNEMGSQFLEPTNLMDEVALTSDIASGGKKIVAEQSKNILGKDFKQIPKMIRDTLSKAGLGNNLVTGLLVGGLGAGALMGNMTEEEQTEVNRGEGMDVEAIRTEVLTAMKDPSGEALKAIRAKYPFLGTQRSKDVSGKAMGGRIGFSNGGDYENKFMELVAQLREAGFSQQQAIEEARKRLGNDMAMGGRIGFAEGGGIMDLGDMENMMMASAPDPMDERNSMMETIAMEEYGKPLKDLSEDEIIEIEVFMDEMGGYSSSSIMDKYKRYIQEMINTGNEPLDFEKFKKMIEESEKTMAKPKPTEPVLPDRQMAQAGGRIGYMGGGMTMGDPRMMMPQSRMPMEEGGIMDLGGMEKDYRAEGGFVPIGREEKADDVPARLSVNEFVFTADAVRNAGGGDIDRGAEVMENMMKNLEQGGQVSEESQGMQGARDMFATSQRLSEVI